MPPRIARPWRALAAAALALAATLTPCAAASADASDAIAGEATVVTPNFWDPRARLEQPSPAEVGPIRFLTTDDFPPFSFRDGGGGLIGFDVDLAAAICDVLKVACAIQVRPFDTLAEGLGEGIGNAIIAGFDPEHAVSGGTPPAAGAAAADPAAPDPTPDLAATQAYFKIPGRFVARAGLTLDPERPAQGTVVAVACGSAHEAFLKRFFPNLLLTCAASASDALAALKSGTATAVFGDALGEARWLHAEAGGCCAFSGGAYLDDRFFGPGLSIVTRTEDRTLRAALDYALREVHRSGKYEELYLRYFPIGLF